MTTLIQVNEHLLVTRLKKHIDIVLCQNIDNGEFIVWNEPYPNQFAYGFYTFKLEEAIQDFKRRSYISENTII